MDERLDKISGVTQKMNFAMKHLHMERNQEKINGWLSPPDPSTNYNKALQQRHQGSGQWLLQDSAYSAWKTEPNSFLWLYGIPGCGKTILSSTIVEDLEKRGVPQKPLYFYFDFNDTNKQTLEKAVLSLITQLYGKREDARRHVDLLYFSCENGKKQPSIESLCKSLQDMLQQAGEVWIILDALDECSTRKEHSAGGLLPWIENIRSSQQANVHILVTSRPEQDIKSAIEKWARKQDIIPIRSGLVAKDINAYIRERVREHEGLSRWQKQVHVQKLIEDTLTVKADGM